MAIDWCSRRMEIQINNDEIRILALFFLLLLGHEGSIKSEMAGRAGPVFGVPLAVCDR